MYKYLSQIFFLRILFTAVLACSLFPASGASGEPGIYDSRFASIHYEEPGQLERFAQKIQPGALTASLNQIFMVGGKTSPAAKSGQYVDQLFQRVQSVLEMPKPDLKVQIRLFDNQDALSLAFFSISGRPTQSPAFYWKETDTIYVQLEKISSGILAHEMGHAVIAHFFIISPPEKISELISQYVDREVTRGHF